MSVNSSFRRCRPVVSVPFLRQGIALGTPEATTTKQHASQPGPDAQSLAWVVGAWAELASSAVLVFL
jgi:hypothetical protein